jgi:hypothetical protein
LPYLGIEAFVALVVVGGYAREEFTDAAARAARALLRAALKGVGASEQM